jgi:hypothetical protein
MSKENILGKIVSDCTSKGVTVLFSSSKTVGTPGCAGSFDGPAKLLEVATDAENWFYVLIHEYCHFKQFLKKPSWFDNDDILFDWLEGQNFSSKKVEKIIKETMVCEADCELRVLKMPVFRYGISKSDYARQASSYVGLYRAIQRKRKWIIPGKGPYKFEHIWKKFPKLTSANWEPSEDLIKLYDECFE